MHADVNGIKIQYEFTGPKSGPVVVCSHCLAGRMEIWDYQANALNNKYRVLRYDIRGHGGSSVPDDGYSMATLASDVIGLIDTLEIEKVHFMGISLGGMIGQAVALMSPERISSLILCNTICMVPETMQLVWKDRIRIVKEKGLSALADEMLERWFSPAFRESNPGTALKIREMILATPVLGYVGCCNQAILSLDCCQEISMISIPTLIMVGENDPVSPVEEARKIHESIHESIMVTLPDAYHLSNIEAADQFNESLSEFMEKANNLVD